jgi:nicotinate-nucleotide adenylyltransferase
MSGDAYPRVVQLETSRAASMLAAVRRGILGGTFDPPHLAHLLAGEVAYRQLDLGAVSFIPAGAPWQKEGETISEPSHRWAMTRAAVEGVDYFSADDREVVRDGWTYTVDTLREIGGDDELVLILGADAARGIQTWNSWQEVLDRVQVAVAPRPGVARSEVEDTFAALPGRPGSSEVTWLDMPVLDISGTMLRRRMAEGRAIRFLVREPVWRYIRDHRLYERRGAS